MSAPILTTRDLSCGYGDKIVLTDLNIDVFLGDIISIIGPNGAGKTTLLKTLARMLKPRKGRITINDRDMTDLARRGGGRELARQIAVVGQSPEVPHLTVTEYVLLGRLPFFSRYQLFETKRDHRLAQKFMSLTDTLHLKDTLMTEISGGERQLVAIARALVQEPVLLLLDEPTSHLDITHQARIMDLITDLNKELSLTVMMVMHDLNLAAEYSDRLVLLDSRRGKIYRIGTPKEVLTPEAIYDVYKTGVQVNPHPVSGKPCLFLAGREAADKQSVFCSR